MTPTITSEAVEAAARALHEQAAIARSLAWDDLGSVHKYVYREKALAILLPAAKHIAASALRDAASRWGEDDWLAAFSAFPVEDDVSAVRATTGWLEARANTLEES